MWSFSLCYGALDVILLCIWRMFISEPVAKRCSVKKGNLRKFAKFTTKYLWQSLFFNKVAGLRPATLLKKRLWHRCFPVNFEKFLRTPLFTEHFRWLLLYFYSCFPETPLQMDDTAEVYVWGGEWGNSPGPLANFVDILWSPWKGPTQKCN